MTELMTKIFDPKTVSLETIGGTRGSGRINREQVINAVAMAGQKAPQGFDALMVKMRNDRNALERLVAAIPAWLNTRKGAIPENAQVACLLAIQIATGKPIPAQLPRLKTLLKQYSARGKRCASNVRKYQLRLRNAEKEMLTATPSQHERLSRYVESLNEAIRREREGLDSWAFRAAAESNLCPRCKGTGIYGVEPCASCHGVGAAVATSDDVYKSLRKLGLVSGKAQFATQHWPLICQCISWLLAEMEECQRTFMAVMEDERH
ncbi:TIGR02642 family protein [Plesiomonas shigelloides]|uniref:TIGR02642 family protein n=1 Tax=Plesiomonas shigelloides TaxID=703 RepID=UPI0012618511|nr:TIGR02642 family protein [Plesiomonas shigelloides]KAB7687382.1 hypothetical protein GBN28_11895 [Plesiomonas shigelloides]